MVTGGSLARTTALGLGEMAVSREPTSELICAGLGSCVAVAVYDPVTKVGGMAHVVLPASPPTADDKPGRYANTAVPALFEQMVRAGASPIRTIVKIAGGAKVTLSDGASDIFKIGERNIVAVRAAIEQRGMRIVAADTGGTVGRTVRMRIENGSVTVERAGAPVKEL